MENNNNSITCGNVNNMTEREREKQKMNEKKSRGVGHRELCVSGHEMIEFETHHH